MNTVKFMQIQISADLDQIKFLMVGCWVGDLNKTEKNQYNTELQLIFGKLDSSFIYFIYLLKHVEAQFVQEL